MVLNTIPNKEKTGKLIWLDFARGISAILVCAGLLRAATFTDYSDLGAGRTIMMPFYFMTSLGHEAVMIFSVLSGFLVGGSVLRKRNEFSVHVYTLARCSRLYTVLIPSLIFTFLIDRVLGFYCPDVLNGEYFDQLHSGPVGPSDYSSSISTLLSNLLFLQTNVSPVFGTNGPLWSLANEFWYFVLFPLAWFFFSVLSRTFSMSEAVALQRISWSLPRFSYFSWYLFLASLGIFRVLETGFWAQDSRGSACSSQDLPTRRTKEFGLL